MRRAVRDLMDDPACQALDRSLSICARTAGIPEDMSKKASDGGGESEPPHPDQAPTADLPANRPPSSPGAGGQASAEANGTTMEAASPPVAAPGVTRLRFGSLGRAWRWFGRQSGGLQVLIGVAALIIAVITLIVTLDPRGETTSPPILRRPTQPVHVNSGVDQLASSTKGGVPGNGDSGRPALDNSGRYIVFTSDSTNLSPLARSGNYNIYRKDRLTGDLTLVSVGFGNTQPNGDSQFPIICANGEICSVFVNCSESHTNTTIQPARLQGSVRKGSSFQYNNAGQRK